MNITRISFLLSLVLSAISAGATVICGTVSDAESNEELIGASVKIDGTSIGAVTDIDGRYSINVKPGTYSITASYVGFSALTQSDIIASADTIVVDFALLIEQQTLGEVSVTAVARRNTEVAQIQRQRQAVVVQSGVSAQQITRTHDRDASEVIRRVPGISIIDDRYVMVRGLSQRYNNVWLNGGAVPSSEADSRAFSFDIIPSGQIDNMTIIKSPAPEYPADYTGGFVLINTKQNVDQAQADISVGIGINDRTHFRNFIYGHNSHSALPKQWNYYPGYSNRIDVLNNGLNNNWLTESSYPLADLKLASSFARQWILDSGARFGLQSTANFSRGYVAQPDMENSLYAPYDLSNDRSVPLRQAVDDQYTRNMRLGAMLNLHFRPADSRHYFEWNNIFNLITKDRFSERWGFNAQNDNINDTEYYYSSRPTVNSQFNGKHTLGIHHVDWSAGYAFAGRSLPDRRLIQRTDRTDQTIGIYRISRESTALDEHIASLAANYSSDLHFGTIKAGVYGEYAHRTYTARQLQYGWQPENNLPAGFMFADDVPATVLIDQNYGPDKLYLYEEVNFLNNYNASRRQVAAYAAYSGRWRQFSIYAGIRFENMRQTLEMNTRQFEESLRKTNYDYTDLFPSVNLTYHIDSKQQLRLAYGRSTNRPEFRELSSSVYYDFDLGSDVMGNADLQAAYINNVDLRYEFYPSRNEQVSVALFYKDFSNPIEWTYTVAGGTDLIYSFTNARSAHNYGVEVDLRKNLDFIGLNDFSLLFNGSLIKSKVTFAPGTTNVDRPMQGQSPYLVNLGLFYNPDFGFSAAVLYNVIGKRIIGVGNRYGTASDGSARNIPNSYEMPRHTIDISLSQKFGRFTLSAGVRDLLAQRYIFKQIEETGGRTIEEVTRSYRPGRTFNLALKYNF